MYLFDGLVVENNQGKKLSLELVVNLAIFLGDSLSARNAGLMLN